jgi:hypothetical protein
MNGKIRIVTPEDGRALGTKVYLPDGAEMAGVMGVEFDPITADSPDVRARITLMVARCDIHAHPMLTLESLREAAAAHGYRLEHGIVTVGNPTVWHFTT